MPKTRKITKCEKCKNPIHAIFYRAGKRVCKRCYLEKDSFKGLEEDIMAREYIQTQIKESEKRVERLNKEFKKGMKHIDRLFKELNRVV